MARAAWRADGGPASAAARQVPVETPIAFSYQGAAHAVMMGTPADLEDFAIGFSLSEQLIGSLAEVEEIRIQPVDNGVLVQLTLAVPRAAVFWERRRHGAGPSGCGLCGLESLDAATRALPRTESNLRMAAPRIAQALSDMMAHQALGRATRAVHAAGFWTAEKGIVHVREDVGRHNALDKLIGALARDGTPACDGVALLTSRISVELVQKAAIAGIAILVAVSAPTSLAITTAEAAGMTLVAVARADGFEIFTHPFRILTEADPSTA